MKRTPKRKKNSGESSFPREGLLACDSQTHTHRWGHNCLKSNMSETASAFHILYIIWNISKVGISDLSRPHCILVLLSHYR